MSDSISLHSRSGNQLLANIPPEDFERLSPHLTVIALTLGEVLHIPEQEIKYVYFPTTGLVSLLAMLEGGETVETGVVGSEGIVGIPIVLGAAISPSQALVQGSGEALRMKATALKGFIENGGPLHDSLLRFTHTLLTQIAQTAACNRVHNLKERLARWLLLSHDRLRRDRFEMTHEFLARMLGTRRAGVTVAANALREAGLIEYVRGQVTLRDRKGLEKASCECYRIVKADFDRLFRANSEIPNGSSPK